MGGAEAGGHTRGPGHTVPAELYNRLARDGPVEALEAEFKLGSAPVVPSELCYRYNTIKWQPRDGGEA